MTKVYNEYIPNGPQTALEFIMTIDAATFESIYKWADKCCGLMEDARQEADSFFAMMKTNAPETGEVGPLIMRSMSDSPRDLQNVITKLSDHRLEMSDRIYDLEILAQNSIPESLTPIKCPDFYCLTALRAVNEWSETVARTLYHALHWLHETKDGMLATPAPSWQDRFLTIDEFNSFMESQKHIRKVLRFATVDRLRWLRAQLEREKLIAQILWEPSE